MSSFRVFSLVLVALLWVPAVGVANPRHTPRYSTAAYKAGRADAERDIKRGVLAVGEWGLIPDPAIWSSYRVILKKKYGITIRRVAGCEVDDIILGHGNGYNHVSHAEITRRYGPGLLDRVYAQAERQHATATR